MDICHAPWSELNDGPLFLRLTALPETKGKKGRPTKKARQVICHFTDGHTETYRSTAQAAEYTDTSEYIIYNAIERIKKGRRGICKSDKGDFWPELVTKMCKKSEKVVDKS